MSPAEQPAAKHDAILAAAEKVFNGSGYAATTMEMVAVEAGISKGSLYNYFQSKEDLFKQVFANAVTVAWAEVEVDEKITGLVNAVCS